MYVNQLFRMYQAQSNISVISILKSLAISRFSLYD